MYIVLEIFIFHRQIISSNKKLSAKTLPYKKGAWIKRLFIILYRCCRYFFFPLPPPDPEPPPFAPPVTVTSAQVDQADAPASLIALTL
jgi:hypothetical protein